MLPSGADDEAGKRRPVRPALFVCGLAVLGVWLACTVLSAFVSSQPVNLLAVGTPIPGALLSIWGWRGQVN